jgi:putative salt-induced outer membrane protein YdiY
VSLQRPCYSFECLQAGWRLSAAPLPSRRNPFALSRTLPRQRSSLRAPATRREWVATYGSNARLGTRYGISAFRDPDTQVQLEVGSGFRLQPYADDGIGHIGPVARGSLLWLQRIGQNARLVQQVRVETGRGDTFVRNSMSLDITLQPNWTLRSSVDLRHDSAADDTAAQGSVQLRYSF